MDAGFLAIKKIKHRKPPPLSQQRRVNEAFSVNETDDHTVAKFDLDKLNSDEREQMSGALTEHSGLSLFEGTVEHGYTLKSAGNAHECPRCSSKTEQMYG